MKFLCIFSMLTSFVIGFGEFKDHLRLIIDKPKLDVPIKHIDYIYLINLDQRPEKYQKGMEQLVPYGILPYRFSAIYGWDLTTETLNAMGVEFQERMHDSEWAFYAHKELDGALDYDFLREDLYGQHFYSKCMSVGGIGCYMSHLSILQDAYDSGYEIIWILEDEIYVEKDPKILGDLIEKLDNLVSRDGWDILYTDTDTKDRHLYGEYNDFDTDLKGLPRMFWRPDLGEPNYLKLSKRTVLNEDFIKIGSRMRTHSMIINRKGMKKILDFAKEHALYLPYDHDLALIPDIQLFNLRYDIVTTSCMKISDVSQDSFSKNGKWDAFKQQVLQDVNNIQGWKNPQKAERVMEFIRRKKPKTLIEIGPFCGAMTYPIAKALQFQNQGILYSIDAWNVEAAIEGVENEKEKEWWAGLDYSSIYQYFQNLISQSQLDAYCYPIYKRSNEAVDLFDEDSIDFLFIDGNASASGSLKDVKGYISKVKKGGYILLNNAQSTQKNPSISYLMKNCTWLKGESFGIDCLFFQKK